MSEDNTAGAATDGSAGQPEPAPSVRLEPAPSVSLEPAPVSLEPAPIAGLEPAPADTGWIQQVSIRASRGQDARVVRFTAEPPTEQ